MSTQQFLLPDVGEGLTEAEIVKWHVALGDAVEHNQVLVEIETAKSIVELPSPFDCTVTGLLVEEGQTVDVGTAIIEIGSPADVGGRSGRSTAPDSLLSPITNGYIVQVAMNSESATAFADYTTTQIGKQIAFVRASTVVSAPQISEAIVGDLLQLSGNLTEQQSDEMARLLQDET